MDNIAELIADALGEARSVGICLDEKVIPLLDPCHRTGAIDISRRIAERRIISEAFLRDIQAFYIFLGRLAEDETSIGWRGHEHDPDCGYTVPIRTDRAIVFTAVHYQLVDLAKLIAAALDAAEALSIANSLFDM